MANNFESKHPRARDGKFTEKYRKESDIVLLHSGDFPDLPDSPNFAGLVPVGERLGGKVIISSIPPKIEDGYFKTFTYQTPDFADIEGNGWHLEFVKQDQHGQIVTMRYKTSYGHAIQYYREDGTLRILRRTDRDDDLVRSVSIPFGQAFHRNGKMASTHYSFNNQTLDDYFGNEIARLTVENRQTKKFVTSAYSNGQTKTEVQFTQRFSKLDGRAGYYQKTEWKFYPDGGLRSETTTNLYGACFNAPGIPARQTYEQGKGLMTSEYLVETEGGTQYHRVSGPAIIDYRKPEDQWYRYFLEGKEYTKVEWAKKTCNE